ncbi:MAG: hypothetical protein K2H46_01465 [Muribaculaceae bacterium]|nr:hypothetical protein [Muribaculaceae bacterium]
MKINNGIITSHRYIGLFLLIIGGFFHALGANDEYERASDKDVLKAQTVIARFDQHTSDGYWYIYWLRFNASIVKGEQPTVTIENSSLGDVEYTIIRAAGSQIRKELWCKDPNGAEVRIVLKYEENPEARNATILKLYVDTYPGTRANQQSIEAVECQNIFRYKDEYDAGSILYSGDNSLVKPIKKWKVGKYPTLFQWMDANIHGL